MRRFHPALISAFTLVVITISSCNKGDQESVGGACGYGYGQYDISYAPPAAEGSFVPFTGTKLSQGKIGYTYDNGQVIFIVGKNFNNICSEEHTNINYGVSFGSAIPHTIPLKVYGDAYYSAFNREVVLFEGMPQAGAVLTDVNLNIGLAQAFKDKPADIDVYVNVRFASLGSFSQDSAYFVQHIGALTASGKYSKHAF
jgi:hypothetical protein